MLQGFFAAWTALAGVSVAVDWIAYRLVSRALDDPFTVDAGQIATANDRRTIMLLVTGAAWAVTGIVFVTWMRRVYTNLRTLGKPLRFAQGWTTGAWLVPILNLWRPKQIMDEMWRGSSREPNWRAAPITPLLHWWWVFWILEFVAGWFDTRAFGEIARSRAEAGLVVALSISVLVSAILAFWVVTLITERQEESAAAMAAAAHGTTALDAARDLSAPAAAPGPHHSWRAIVALPILGVASTVGGVVLLALPAVARAAPAVVTETGRYSAHGVSFDCPAGLVAREAGFPPDDTAGLVVAADPARTRVLTVEWEYDRWGIRAREAAAALDAELATIEADLGTPLTRGTLTEIVIDDQPAAYRTWSAVRDDRPVAGVTGVVSCGWVHVLTIRSVRIGGGLAEEAMADFQAVLTSTDC